MALRGNEMEDARDFKAFKNLHTDDKLDMMFLSMNCTKHDERITNLEKWRYKIVGALALILAVGGALITIGDKIFR